MSHTETGRVALGIGGPDDSCGFPSESSGFQSESFGVAAGAAAAGGSKNVAAGPGFPPSDWLPVTSQVRHRQTR